MSELFALDQVENDRLVLEAADRKRDLIDFAVKKFAPQLEGQSGVKAIHLYSTNATLRSAIREEFSSRKVVVVEHTGEAKKSSKGNEVNQSAPFGNLKLPDKADLVVTKSALNSKIERLAAGLGAMPVVLPEGFDYVRARLEKAGVLVLVGADQK